MKALIAITCAAVLAAIGYFFWGEYQAHSERARLDMAAAMQRAADARFMTAKSDCYDEFKRHIQAKVGADLLPIDRQEECAPFFTASEITGWREEMR